MRSVNNHLSNHDKYGKELYFFFVKEINGINIFWNYYTFCEYSDKCEQNVIVKTKYIYYNGKIWNIMAC